MKLFLLILIFVFAPFYGTSAETSTASITTAVDAAGRGDIRVLRDWISKGGDPDQADAEGWTPLLKAAARGQAKVVDFLLNNSVRKADPDKPFAPSGALPIHMAGHSGSVKVASLLLAARTKDLDAVWLLNGHTLLLEAAFYGHTELAAFAVAKGANLAATTVRGLTAVDFAQQFDNQPLLRIVSVPAVSDSAKMAYFTSLLDRLRVPVPLAEAEIQKKSDALAALISDSIKRVAREPGQFDSLVDAIDACMTGTDVNRRGGILRQPPLVVTVTGINENPNPGVAASLRLRVARMLLDRGASPLVYEIHPMGANAIIRASVFGHLDILRLMGSRITAAELAGALNERPAVNGLTALHDAVLRASTANESRLTGYLDQIRWEVASGARSDIEDFSGLTQYQYGENIVEPVRRTVILDALKPAAATPQWNHTAFGVSDLDAAIKWYGDVFGFLPLNKPIIYRQTDAEAWQRAIILFGSDITQVRMVRLRAPGAPMLQVVELFEVKPSEPRSLHPRSGALHGSLIVGNVEMLADRIVSRGGRILDRAIFREIHITFCSDPFGNILELASSPW